MTLEDVSLITGLAINGRPLCMSTNSDGWREQMIALIGMAPTEAEDDVEEGEEKKKRERKAAGAAFTWIQNNFATCPPDATDDVIQTHAVLPSFRPSVLPSMLSFGRWTPSPCKHLHTNMAESSHLSPSPCPKMRSPTCVACLLG